MASTMRILVIDDDAIFSRYLAEVLTHLGHVAESVNDGLLGFERCLRDVYDLVICDVRMPLILGTELVAELRRDLPSYPSSSSRRSPTNSSRRKPHERGAWLLVQALRRCGVGRSTRASDGDTQPLAS